MKHISIKVADDFYRDIKTMSMIDDGGGDVGPYIRKVLERHIEQNRDKIEEFRRMVATTPGPAPMSGEEFENLTKS